MQRNFPEKKNWKEKENCSVLSQFFFCKIRSGCIFQCFRKLKIQIFSWWGPHSLGNLTNIIKSCILQFPNSIQTQNLFISWLTSWFRLNNLHIRIIWIEPRFSSFVFTLWMGYCTIFLSNLINYTHTKKSVN